MKFQSLKIFFMIILPIYLLAQDDVSFPKKLDATGFKEVLVETDNLLISGQPDSASFEKLKQQGVTTIINLRTAREMDNRNLVPFDEKEVVENLGMNYIHIPLGGPDNPYTKQVLNTFADSLANAKGKVLLHCTVAGRASHMFAAYLIEYKGFSPQKAIEYAKAVNFGDLPIEGLLNKKMIIDFE